MWYTILITLVVDIAGLLIIYAVLSDRVRRATAAASQIAALRDEVSRLVVELNQTTERNVALMEDRIASLNEAGAAADKKIGILKREIEKHDVGAQIHSRLAEERQSAQARATYKPPTQTRAAAEDAVPQPARGRPAEAPSLPVELSEQSAAGDKQDLRQRIMMLHRSGFPSSLIATRVGMPIGEVELIISLEQRKGQG